MRALALAAGLFLAACSGATDDPEAEFERALAEARDKARASLSLFWDHFDQPAEDEYDFSLKVALPRRDGQAGVEEAWVDHVARAPDRIVGELSGAPRYLGGLPEGAVVDFQESQIVDWAFMQGQQLLGHYSTRVLLPTMDALQAEWLRPLLSDTPEGDSQEGSR